MTELAVLFKDYGLIAVVVVLLLALKTVTEWWKDSMTARLEDHKATAERATVITERMATALERQASTNSDIAENMRDLRDGQGEIQKVTTEAALTAAAGLKETTRLLGDLRPAQGRQATGGPR